MRLVCENGFYKFFPEYIGEVKLFQNKYGVRLYQKNDFYTFEALKDFPNYSFAGQVLYKLLPAVVNYAGRPEDVLNKNKLTYNLKLGTITPRETIIQKLSYAQGAFISSPNLPQAFALDEDLNKITGFSGFLDVKMGMYKVERFFYEDI